MKLYNIIEIMVVNETLNHMKQLKYWQLMKIMNKVHTIMRNEYYENYESNEATVMKVKL